MERLSEYLGADIFIDGKKAGRITDFFISPRQKKISGLSGITSRGLVRNGFFIPRSGILHLDKNGCVADGKKIFYTLALSEEIGDISVYSTIGSDRIGDVYFLPETLEIKRLSIKKGFFDDLIFGRETVDISDIFITGKGKIKREREG